MVLAPHTSMGALLVRTTDTLITHSLWNAVAIEIVELATDLISWVFTALATAGILKTDVGKLTRQDLQDRRTRLSNPATMAADLEAPDLRKRAIEEWQEVLDSPLSLIPLLEDLLADPDWEEIDPSPEAIVHAFSARAKELMAEAEK